MVTKENMPPIRHSEIEELGRSPAFCGLLPLCFCGYNPSNLACLRVTWELDGTQISDSHCGLKKKCTT